MTQTLKNTIAERLAGRVTTFGFAPVERFGRIGLVHHPRFGSLLRLGAVVTDAELPGDEIQDAFPCPKKCNACHKSCPPGAFADAGTFAKLTCLGHTIKHAIYPLALKDEQGLAHIERVINTAGYNYWLDCNECLRVCSNNRQKKTVREKNCAL